MAADIFEKIQANRGPLGMHAKESHGYFTFPKLEGEIGPHMNFRGKEKLNWSLNNYLGLANHPEVRKADADAAADFGYGSPMGARMMSGNSNYHEQLENELSAFVGKQDTILANFGYQAVVSAIDAKEAEAARQAEEARKAEEARQAQEQAAAQPGDTTTVYITRTGSHYHLNPNCRGLNRSKSTTPVSLSEAQALGLTLCGFE